MAEGCPYDCITKATAEKLELKVDKIHDFVTKVEGVMAFLGWSGKFVGGVTAVIGIVYGISKAI